MERALGFIGLHNRQPGFISTPSVNTNCLPVIQLYKCTNFIAEAHIKLFSKLLGFRQSFFLSIIYVYLLILV